MVRGRRFREEGGMKRRAFLRGAGAGLAAGALAAPAAANAQATVRWRLASSFPKSLDTLYGNTERFCQRIGAVTGGKFVIRPFAGGEIVPGLQVLDAVQQGTVECGHSASYYYVGKNKAFAFDCALPFGLTARQQNAWMYHGGGLKLMRELFAQYNIVNFPGGNTGTQMAGWFRKEVKSLADLKGLKMRIPGIGGEILARLGVVPQTLAGGDVYPALERGTIDATEWVGPYDDEKLGFHKIAKYYYYPGWWEPGPMVSFYVNRKAWDALPKEFQQAFEAAAAEAHVHMLAEYDARNPPALARLLAQGVQLREFPKDVMQAALREALALYDEESARNPAFGRVYAEWKKFRAEQFQWFATAELSYASFAFTAKP
jgi:TRAP-type mannitol/chloroaromatic compound transport system substrate-binding protein